MSQTYIPGIVDNIKSDSTPYSPMIEASTNSIDAINESGRTDGRIDITIERENILPDMQSDELPEILSITISDNGVGFNDKNRDSFDTVYGPKKKPLAARVLDAFFTCVTLLAPVSKAITFRTLYYVGVFSTSVKSTVLS